MISKSSEQLTNAQTERTQAGRTQTEPLTLNVGGLGGVHRDVRSPEDLLANAVSTSLSKTDVNGDLERATVGERNVFSQAVEDYPSEVFSKTSGEQFHQEPNDDSMALVPCEMIEVSEERGVAVFWFDTESDIRLRTSAPLSRFPPEILLEGVEFMWDARNHRATRRTWDTRETLAAMEKYKSAFSDEPEMNGKTKEKK